MRFDGAQPSPSARGQLRRRAPVLIWDETHDLLAQVLRPESFWHRKYSVTQQARGRMSGPRASSLLKASGEHKQRGGRTPRRERTRGTGHSVPSLALPPSPPLHGRLRLRFNAEAGSRSRKCILMLRPGPESRGPGQPPGLRVPLPGKGWGGPRAAAGGDPWPPPPSGPSRAGLRARPAGREDGHLAGGGPRSCRSGWRGARRPTPSDRPVAPRKPPLYPSPPNLESPGRARSREPVPSPRGAPRPQPPGPPGMHRPAPLQAPPRRPRARPGPSARCPRPCRRRHESPGRTEGAAERRPGLGVRLRQTPPHPAHPTPCACLPGARARARARKSGVGAQSGPRRGRLRAARRRRAGRVVREPQGPRQQRPPAGLRREPPPPPAPRARPLGPGAQPRRAASGGTTTPGEERAVAGAGAVAQRAGGGMRAGERAARAPRPRGRLWPVLAVLAAAAAGCARAAMDECADEGGRPQRCMPEFVNAAFNVTVVATNTCGAPPEEYCVQTGVTGVTKSCHLCDAAQPHLQHGAAFLTDYNNQADTTWWQSQTMLAGVQYPHAINLTLHLGKRPRAPGPARADVPFPGLRPDPARSVPRGQHASRQQLSVCFAFLFSFFLLTRPDSPSLD